MKQKDLVLKTAISFSSLLIMSGGFAHTFNSKYLQQHAVPLSLTSTIVLGILLLAVGVFVLPRMEGRHIRSLSTATILAGLLSMGVGGKLVSNAYAAPLTCTISSPALTTDIGCSQNLEGGHNAIIFNNSDSPIQVAFSPTTDHLSNLSSSNSQAKAMEITRLVKGPIERSEILQQGQQEQTCAFPVAQLAIGEQCHFDHRMHHTSMNDY